ncbi:rho GTPase-activating protein 7-like isoform X3 [Watersipora subatra]|uniref:rho GTPase-activating protein 7-like isoform X3 n=1 Tax=Watersipora subatra TaxID=2589382 RepID=UPI00355B89CF
MTVTVISADSTNMLAAREKDKTECVTRSSQRSVGESITTYPLYRTNTFPRSRNKANCSKKPVGSPVMLPLDSEKISVELSPPAIPISGSLRGFRRGFSEQVQRISRGTMDKLHRINRARRLAEIETLEAISWLVQAGFPQYVQLFEEAQLPLDIDTVQRDHSFLEEQQLESLYRRLNILNKSVHMKLDINSKKPSYATGGEEDEEETCVLSDKWCYEQSSGRWFHVDPVARLRSSSSRDSVITDETGEEPAGSPSPVLHLKDLGYSNNNTLKVNVTNEQSASESSSSTTSPKSTQPLEIKSKRNGGFFQRHVGSLTRRNSQKGSKRDRTIGGGGVTAPSISAPTLVNNEAMNERMERLGCVQISNGEASERVDGGLLRSASSDQCCDSCSLNGYLTEYRLPSDYVHGTFPKQLLETNTPSRQTSISQCCHSRSSSTKTGVHQQASSNRLSVYDNLDNLPLEDDFPSVTALPTPNTQARRELDAVLHDLLINITKIDFDSGGDTLPNVTAASDSAIVSPMSEELSSITSDTHADTLEPLSPELTPEQRRRGSVKGSSNEELSGSLEEETGDARQTEETVWRERRDSGVGSSLTREPSERKKKVRLRWHSFVASHRPSFNSLNQHISSLSASQIMYLRRLALLKVTSLMEQYSPSHKSGFSLQLVNRLMKKGGKPTDYSDKTVFGLPLSLILQKTGQPLPQCILHAMRYLRKSASDSVGIFRRSGVKSRIQKLRNDLEQDPDNVAQFDSFQAYDVADMFKQYLRELPECLVTTKLSDTFIAIHQHVPQELRLEAMQACALLLPDESREVLESLLYFLSDMASYHEENQMTANNLAVCFAPSLFNIHNRSAQTKSPKTTQKNAPIADQKEILEHRSATDCLTSMITNCKKVFRVPENFFSQCSSSSAYTDGGEPAPLSLLGAAPDYHSHTESCIQGLLKESKDKGWTSIPQVALGHAVTEEVDVSYKKVNDSNPLRLWKCCIELEADPQVILQRVLNERQKWDEDLLKWRTVEKLDSELDVFQYVMTSMAPQPSREYLVLRTWKSDLPKGACAVVTHSIDHPASSLGGGIRGMVLASHYLIEPTDGSRCKLTHISRIDSRGRQPKWYNRSYGVLAANNLIKIKESLSKDLSVHETKL